MASQHNTRAHRMALTRRAMLAGLGSSAIASMVARTSLGQEASPPATPTIQQTGTGDMPTQGGMRPGPVGQQPPEVDAIIIVPTAIAIEDAGIDAEVEQLDIVNGKMEDPTGPWIVSWYRQGAGLGEIGNVLMAGHVDYWGVGPSVFYNVRDLQPGDVINVTGDNGSTYTYTVTSNETYAVEELVSGKMAELAAPTPTEVLTMFTCGGEFDYVNGEYLSRTVVRADRQPDSSTPTAHRQ